MPETVPFHKRHLQLDVCSGLTRAFNLVAALLPGSLNLLVGLDCLELKLPRLFLTLTVVGISVSLQTHDITL